MKEIKTNKLIKSELILFNNVFSQVKVKGLEQQPYINYLHLKIKVSEIIEQVQKQQTDGIKNVLKELGYREGDKVPKDKEMDVNEKLNAVLEKLLSEDVELDTHVLSQDDFFKCILDIEENKNMTTEQKASLMKFLVK